MPLNRASLEYRLRADPFSMEMAMPVLFQSMVPSRVAGVLNTPDPKCPDGAKAVLSAAWGLGTSVAARRARVLDEIPERAGFKVGDGGDLVVARAIDLTEEPFTAGLYLICRLIGFTRQLDVLLKSDADISFFMDWFHDVADRGPAMQE